ncbi:CAP domain-containing protein [Demequina sediminicola]|uniref:CAP domain-containing protein n=1 Tax=Demequina sediminicola TaxID=1095026 RepID=UPI00137927E4|nr:CAP domain-containing protein [Demequina sediminicola]
MPLHPRPLRTTVASALMLGAAVALTGCTQSSDSVELPAAGEFASEVFATVNAMRVEEGVDLLQRSACLDAYAEERAALLPGSVNVPREDLPADCGDYDYAGENVSRSDQTAVEVVDTWAGNTNQYPNLVDPQFEIAGVGCVPVSAADNSEVAQGDEAIGGMACSMIFLGYTP